MAPQISYSGVYIEELPSGIRKIRPAQTSVTGIIGSFVEGPIHRAKRIRNWKAFTQTFGGLSKNHLASYSVKQFFDNGGITLWIVRTEPQNAITAQALLQGLYVFAKKPFLNILFIPETNQLESRAATKVYREVIRIAEQHHAMYILDPPIPGRSPSTTSLMASWISRQKTIRHSQVVIYVPGIRVHYSRNVKQTILIPASGTLAGIWARIDNTKGVWRAPAGTEAKLRNVHSLERKMNTQNVETLAKNGVNALRLSPLKQIVPWGARTLATNSEWKYVPIRRLGLFIESSVQRGTQWVVFEPNDEPLWAIIRQSVGNFLNGLFRKGALQGARPEEAYFVRCGHDTMSANDQQIGRVNIVIGFAPLKPAEFIILTIQQHAQDPGKS